MSVISHVIIAGFSGPRILDWQQEQELPRILNGLFFRVSNHFQ
jgi:hypothetical protein